MYLLGERIKKIRKENKVTQNEFAKILGVSQTHISKIEKGIEKPSETLLLFMSYRYSVDINWLKSGEGNYYPEGGADTFGLLNHYYSSRNIFEKKIFEFNNSELWNYIFSVSFIMKILTLDFRKDQYEKQKQYLNYIYDIVNYLKIIIDSTINNSKIDYENINDIFSKIKISIEKIIETIT